MSNTGIVRPLLQQLMIYAQLMRLNKPIGIWLLAWPMLWALWVAAEGFPDQRILIIFCIGALVTRSAGCVINDIADRNIDGHVRRTRMRPLANGDIGIAEAIAVFVALGLVAIGLVTMLNPLTQILAGAATVLMIAYPFMKRFLSVPQLILGLAFAMAIPMAFAALTGEIDAVAWFIFAITVVWAVIYDTMYAMCDREDDVIAGVRSTAILFGEADRFVIGALQVLMLLGLLMLGDRLTLGGWYYLSVIATAVFMIYQQVLIRERDPMRCFQAFLNNHFIGMVLFIGIALHYAYV